jgi:phosphopantothenoylcysteine decarboxylase / phosphopantothenate---cysteine ligase
MRVTVGVTGGIAAYKAADLVRELGRRALEVQVVMTEGAQRFVQPLTFQALTGRRVLTSLWEEAPGGDPGERTSSIDHIEVASATDALLVAPASANTLARFAHGFADDFLSTLYLATQAPVVLAPAMNARMWEHPAVQANVETLAARGALVVPPGVGELACGMVGAGRLAPQEQIVEAVLSVLHRRNDLAGETVLVTAGGTREAVDPVRYIGNRSSGKMGYALAEAAQSRGARVLLVSAPTALRTPPGVELVPVTTADEMRAAVFSRLAESTIVIKAAAVADYRPRLAADQKLKRTGPRMLELDPTEDILSEVVRRKHPGLLVIGFAAETEDALAHGRDKLLRKGADAIVLNDVSRPGLGFDSDRNAATFLTRATAIDLPAMAKRSLADRILGEILSLRRPQKLIAETSLISAHDLRP